MPVCAKAMLFGMLVHETIEDVHRAALRKEEATITTENITKWFDANYASISKTERTYLAEPQREAALKQVLRYVDRQRGSWPLIQRTEVDVSFVKQDYIIGGKIDLIKGENGVPVITYPYTRTAVESTIAAFDETVHKILKKDYRRRLSDRKVCKNCDFRFCCQNQ